MIDHDAAMRIADRHLKLETHIERHLRTADYEGPEFPLPVNSAIVTLARAYKDVVRERNELQKLVEEGLELMNRRVALLEMKEDSALLAAIPERGIKQ